jgi:hypothetical protein
MKSSSLIPRQYQYTLPTEIPVFAQLYFRVVPGKEVVAVGVPTPKRQSFVQSSPNLDLACVAT